jgi:murein DD-endopeptidase MepM/ murein hydrolase activator NlpD
MLSKSKMENSKYLFDNLKEHFRKIEDTSNSYSYPFPKGTVVKGILKTIPSHAGAFKGAMDFLVDLGTPILSPFEGEVIKVVDGNDKYGPSEDFAPYLNYITIKHANGEFSQPAHLAKGSALVKEGDHVLEGQQIGVTGNSGWMTEPHLHFFVFKSANVKPGFVGLKVRFKKGNSMGRP